MAEVLGPCGCPGRINCHSWTGPSRRSGLCMMFSLKMSRGTTWLLVSYSIVYSIVYSTVSSISLSLSVCFTFDSVSIGLGGCQQRSLSIRDNFKNGPSTRRDRPTEESVSLSNRVKAQIGPARAIEPVSLELHFRHGRLGQGAPPF